MYVTGQAASVASLKINPMGMAKGTAIGPMREVTSTLSAKTAVPTRVLVMESDAPSDPQNAVLSTVQ